MFNDADQLGFLEILQKTQLEKEELKRTLLSLTNGRQQLLQRRADGKELNGKEIDDDEVIALNTNYKPERRRIKVNMV